MTALDRLAIAGALVPVSTRRRREWRRRWASLWRRHGPTLLIAFAAGLILGSYAALLTRLCSS